MVEQRNFRPAFNGFNREDVVHYIEQINTQHASELSQLNADMQYLQEKLTQYEAMADESAHAVSADCEQLIEEQTARIAQLEQQLAEAGVDAETPDLTQTIEAQAAALVEQSDKIEALEQQLAQVREAAQTTEALLEEAEAENRRLQELLDTALSRQNHLQTQQETELSIYRRAERVERKATERALRIHDQVNGALADATTRVDETAVQLAEAVDAAMQQIKQLQLAVAGSKQVLQDTAATLYAVRPVPEEE